MERLSANGLFVYQPINLSKKVLTVESAPRQIQVRQGRAKAEFQRNVACAARRSFLGVGTLVYQTGQDEYKIDAPLSWLHERSISFIALHRPISVGIRPVEYLIERLSANGLLVYHFAIKLVFLGVPVS
jgi:hypothetical protein